MADYYLAAFRSRTQTLAFLEVLKKYRIECYTVNTPKEAGVGCGLSVKFNKQCFAFVKKVLWQQRLDSFAGFFFVENRCGRNFIKAI